MSIPPQSATAKLHLDAAVLANFRRGLVALFVMGAVGAGFELLLLEHTDTPWQPIPLALLASSLLTLLWCRSSSSLSWRVFQALMWLFVAAGMLGVFLHLRGNMQFAIELFPSATSVELFKEAIFGATPALAPGTMVLLGGLGLLVTYRHPALSSADGDRL